MLVLVLLFIIILCIIIFCFVFFSVELCIFRNDNVKIGDEESIEGD
jgi:hypothetical protein